MLAAVAVLVWVVARVVHAVVATRGIGAACLDLDLERKVDGEGQGQDDSDYKKGTDTAKENFAVTREASAVR